MKPETPHTFPEAFNIWEAWTNRMDEINAVKGEAMLNDALKVLNDWGYRVVKLTDAHPLDRPVWVVEEEL